MYSLLFSVAAKKEEERTRDLFQKNKDIITDKTVYNLCINCVCMCQRRHYYNVILMSIN